MLNTSVYILFYEIIMTRARQHLQYAYGLMLHLNLSTNNTAHAHIGYGVVQRKRTLYSIYTQQ